MKTEDGVEIKNAGRGATRAVKGRMTVQNRGRFGYGFSISVQDPGSTSGVRVLYLEKSDVEDLLDAGDALLDTLA